MKYRILYSPEAKQDLNEIWEYISEEMANPDAAANMADSIMDTIDSLHAFPERGAPLSSVTETESSYRFVLAENYMAFYRVQEDTVYVDRIFYQRREYLRVLFGESR